ncbi:MAG: RcnB family protein [Luteimonas sp.]
MKSLLLAASVSLLLSTALLSPSVSAEPGHGGGHGHSHDNGGDKHERGDRGDRGDDRDRGERGRWSGDRHGHRYAYGHGGYHDNGLHRGHYKFERGERVPYIYRQQRYYVRDYRAYHLAPPPRGYRWVQPESGRYLLISTATGLISQLLGY